MRRIKIFSTYGERNNSTKYKCVIFLKFKWTTRKLTLSHFGSQFQWSKRKHIFTTERAIRADKVTGGPPTNFTKEQGHLNWQSLLKRSVPHAAFSSLKPWKFHNTEGWISLLFRVVCQVATNKPADRKRFLLSCASSSESLGDIASRISDL